jgi:prophage maintenance system killer protein
MTDSQQLIYQTATGALEVQLDTTQDTVWLSQMQMSQLFDTSIDNISLHLKNIYLEEELEEIPTTEDFSLVRLEGSRQVKRKIKHYNLDAIISVGYRVSSKRAVLFRQWATRTLRDHLTQGFTLNQQRLTQNAQAFAAALALIQKTAHSPALTTDMGRGLVDVIARYAQSFLWLQQYDEGLLSQPIEQTGGTLPSLEQARQSLARLKTDLMARGEATELFARERADGLAALLGNLDQTVFGDPAYPSIESKAAHLLYFVIKNHPFADGNKRSGAFLFVDFLNHNHRLLDRNGHAVINETGLAALALLIAESDPKQKDTMIQLVMHMLAMPHPMHQDNQP